MKRRLGVSHRSGLIEVWAREIYLEPDELAGGKAVPAMVTGVPVVPVATLDAIDG